MMKFWRHCFYAFLLSTLVLKSAAFILQTIGGTIILGSGFGNQELFQIWYPIINIDNFFGFFLEQIFTLFCLIISFYWIKKLSIAKKKNFKRFPGTIPLFVTFLILIALSSHWIISLIFLVLFFFISRTKTLANNQVLTQNNTAI